VRSKIQTRTVIAVSVCLALTACGGGGSGGNPYIAPSSGFSSVPFYTPARVDSVAPIDSSSFVYNSSALISQDINGNGSQSLILAGRATLDSNGVHNNYNLQIWDWENGSLVNKTSQWFSGTDNKIVGTEPSVKFADFDGDGKIDMYVSPYTDTNIYGPGIVYFNEGQRFTRVNIDLENTNGHGSALYDLDKDGYMDIVTTGLRFTFGGPNRTFTTYWGRGDYPGGGGDVAVADFLGNGSSTLILTDMNSNQDGNNRLYSWRKKDDGVYISQIGTLPTPRFLLPKWSSYGFSGSHDIRVLAFDFDNSGTVDAVIFSRPWLTNGQWPSFSEIQFNKNLGGGVFQDVTDTTLIGYDNTLPAPYHPVLADINNDGLIDIVLGGTQWDSNRGAQVLIHTKDHKYVASYADIIQAFADQSLNLEKTINSTASFGANGIAFVRGPDGVMYLATAITYEENNQHKKAIYLSRLGITQPSAQATSDVIKQAWPWMSSGQVNTVLASSSISWLNGLPVIDFDKALSPIGGLGIALNGRDSTRIPITGSIRVPGMDRNLLNNVTAVDILGRNFQINLTSFDRPVEPMNIAFSDVKSSNDSWSSRFVSNNLVERDGFRAAGDAQNWTTGAVLQPFGRESPWSMTLTATQMQGSPWLEFSGMFGQVRSSAILETNMTRKWNNGYWLQAGGMQTSTNFTPGLVTNVSNIYSMYAVAGWRDQDWGVYGGLQPYVVSGNVDLKLPNRVDSQGVLHYTKHRVDIETPVVGFVGTQYRLQKQNRSWNITGVVNSLGHSLIKADYQYRF